MPTIRLLPFADADGPGNMAADEVMLEAASGRGVASLRFYTWSAPTLSLGYFHPASVVAPLRERMPGFPPADPTTEQVVPHRRKLAWVRRATGGAAIVHHRELTYALALPAGPEWHPREQAWICRLHRSLQAVLRDLGVSSHVVACGEERKLGEVLCFLHQTPGDLVIDGSKVAGSAQRRMKGSLLQHGSLLLRRSEFAPELPGMCDLAGRDLFAPEGLAGLLAGRFAADTGWSVEPGDWTAEELTRVHDLRADKYGTREWNGKR